MLGAHTQTHNTLEACIKDRMPAAKVTEDKMPAIKMAEDKMPAAKVADIVPAVKVVKTKMSMAEETDIRIKVPAAKDKMSAVKETDIKTKMPAAEGADTKDKTSARRGRNLRELKRRNYSVSKAFKTLLGDALQPDDDLPVRKLSVTAARGGQWTGLTNFGWISLKSEWVEQNFERWFIHECKDKAGKKVNVPAGRAADTADGPLLLHDVPNAYPQTDSSKCAFFGVAAALQHIKAVDADGRPFDRALAELYGPDTRFKPMQAVAKYVHDRVPGWRVRKIAGFDPLVASVPPDAVVLARLEASDGDVTHAVGLADGKIFDANRKSAMPLCKEALDAACLGDATFARVMSALVITPSSATRKHACGSEGERPAKKVRV